MNIIERLIKLTVNNSEANTALNSTATNLDKVDKNTTKVTQSTKTMTKETHNLTEAAVKNGGAMGLLNELTGGLAMTFKDASEAIGLAGVTLNSFKGIMIATGIGALVVAVGYLAENWEKVRDALTGAAAAQEEYNAKLYTNEKIRKDIANITNKEIALLEKSKEEAIARGASSKDLLKIDLDIVKAKVAQNEVDKATFKSDIANSDNKIKNVGDLADLEQKLADQKKNTAFMESERNNKQSLWTGNILEDVIRRSKEEEKNIQRQITNFKATDEEYKKKTASEQKLAEAQVSGIVLATDKQRLLNGETAKNKVEQDKIIAINNSLIKAEEARYQQLLKIKQVIDDNVAAFAKDVNMTESQLAAKALGKEYAQLIQIYDAREKLLKQQKDAIVLAEQGGVSEKEQKILNTIQAQIIAYDELIKKKEASILIAPEVDTTLNARLNAIKLNGESEIAMIKGFTFDALRLRQEAMKIEEKLREDSIKKQIDDNARLLADNQNNFNNKVITETQYTAIKNDLTTKANEYASNLAIEQANNAAANNSIQLDTYMAYIDKKKEIDNQYYENISIVSQNLQGFLGQLQDENLIKSRDLRNVLLIAEKGLAIAGIVMSTIKTNAELKSTAIKETTASIASYASYDYVGGSLHAAAATSAGAGVVANNVSAGISIASILATTLTSWNRPSSSGGGTGGGGGAAGPQAQFNIVGASGNNQLAAAIGAAQNKPVNAYVVGSDMTTQQALDRNRITTATFL